MRKKIVIGNWKMNLTLHEGESLLISLLDFLKNDLHKTDVVVAPSFINLANAVKLLSGSGIKVSAQNCSSESHGAFTGEVSAKMIKTAGAEYTIIGHSERRMLFGETNETLLKKIKRSLENNLIPIYCIGETLTERESGRHFDVIKKQMTDVFFKLEEIVPEKIILAYEPVWAIGTGRTASPEQAQEVHHYIRSIIEKEKDKKFAESIRILYGGSCNPQNAASLFSLPDVDGGLIGGASLKAKDFTEIIKAAN